MRNMYLCGLINRCEGESEICKKERFLTVFCPLCKISKMSVTGVLWQSEEKESKIQKQRIMRKTERDRKREEERQERQRQRQWEGC